jgi:hypothetical protein
VLSVKVVELDEQDIRHERVRDRLAVVHDPALWPLPWVRGAVETQTRLSLPIRVWDKALSVDFSTLSAIPELGVLERTDNLIDEVRLA